MGELSAETPPTLRPMQQQPGAYSQYYSLQYGAGGWHVITPNTRVASYPVSSAGMVPMLPVMQSVPQWNGSQYMAYYSQYPPQAAAPSNPQSQFQAAQFGGHAVQVQWPAPNRVHENGAAAMAPAACAVGSVATGSAAGGAVGSVAGSVPPILAAPSYDLVVSGKPKSKTNNQRQRQR